jgi:hypothetical protein
MYHDTLKTNASIMEAYKKMSEAKSVNKKELVKVEKEIEKVASEIKEDKLEEHFSSIRAIVEDKTLTEDTIQEERLDEIFGAIKSLITGKKTPKDPTKKGFHVYDSSMNHKAGPFETREDARQHAAKLNEKPFNLTGHDVHFSEGGEEAKKINESMNDHEGDADYAQWMGSVKSAFPNKELKFKNRVESGTHTTSAEVSGEDRSYGVYDHDSKEAHVFHECFITEEKMTAAQLAKREEIVKGMKKNFADFEKRYGDKANDVMYATATKQALEENITTVYDEASGSKHETQYGKGTFKAYGKTFGTYVFHTPDEANKFMETPEGERHGYIGQSEDGLYHVAHMDDQGT